MFEKYQSKPRQIEAVQFTEENKDMLLNALMGQYTPDFEPIIKVTTIHGDVAIVRLGDWIVKDKEKGFYYPIKNDIFHNNYI